MGDIFGGGGGGQQPSTTTTTQTLSPEQQRLINLVLPVAEKFVSQPPTLFPGSTIQPPDPLQQQAQQSVLSLAQPGGTLEQLAGSAGSASQFLLGPVLFPESNPALRAATEAAVRPLTENFENVVLPGIRQEAITAGGFGGSRQGIAEGLASQGLLRQIGDTTATIEATAFQRSLDAMTRALFAAPSVSQLALQPTAAIEAVGAQRQQREQALLSEEAQRFIAEQLLPFAAAQDVAALAFGIPGGQTVSATTLPGSPSGDSDFFEDAIDIASILLPLFFG